MQQPEDQPVGTLVDRYGGEFSVRPFGHVRAVVAERESTGGPCGLAYVTPPVRLMRQHTEQGRSALRALALTLAEIDSLAVDADVRRQGVGSALLEETERWLANLGCRVVMAKIARGEYAVMRWYRRRGYLVAAQGEPFRVWLPGLELSCDDGDDGYHLALKGLGVSLRRARQGADTFVTVEDGRRSTTSSALAER
ncbi:GNAT family N-acetyltransferase [Streptomyces actinomycinicus]|uniref:GNAT family N-acetyltransferase n=1 Tax=Streptomyces actinomycinicus TaxID=1695166 RepID=A0A937ERI0_9ACTN|nr:GNAT family N-acetyltransferase [Streptomyces actinomycinicus]MBL1086780.1 GNAT family N-acetyltransferase [Streptomyces actinomycinicus]